MKVILGRYMDGGAWPDALHTGTTSPSAKVVDGVKICGPAGFLSLLEERMGLPIPDMHGSERIASVWRALNDFLSLEPRAFYKKSFSCDGWNTAKRVLQLRDELTLAGTFESELGELDACAQLCHKAGLSRLAQFYKLERYYGQSFGSGMADRLRLILRCLRDGWGLYGLAEVDMVTPREFWPTPWQSLFDLMKKEGVKFEDRPQPTGMFSCSSDTQFFQLEADNISEAAEALAAVLAVRCEEGGLGRTVILRQEESIELDGALDRQGLANTGCRMRTVARPYIQMIPLYLRLQFFPFEPETLRQFLLLPVSPLDGKLARRLLAALQREEFSPYFDKEHQPNLEGWPKGWRRVFLDEKGVPDAQRLEQIHWFCPKERRSGWSASAHDMAEAVRTLGVWAARSVLNELPMTAELCARSARTLESIGGELSRQDFEKVMDSILGDGEKLSERRPAMPWTVLTSPGQLWDGADTVVWWDFTNDGCAVRETDTWSLPEKDWLTAHNCLPDDSERERKARLAASFQPLYHARVRFIAVRSRFKNGEESVDHPLMSGLNKGLFRRVQARDVLNGKGEDFWAVPCEPVPAPMPVQPWSSDKGRTLMLPAELYPSGLDKMFSCPAAWYFENILGLRPQSTTLSGEAVLHGNIAHEVMEYLLKNHVRVDELDSLHADIMRLLHGAAERKAARLALPEYEPQLRAMAEQLASSYSRLVRLMEERGLEFHSSEQSFIGELDGIPCKGRYDLALKRQGEAEPCLVLDMKWSRKSTFQEQIEKGLSVQLAAYAYLLANGRPESGVSGPVIIEDAGYFLLPREEIVLNSSGGVPLARQWDKVCEQWAAMRADMESGRLYLAKAGSKKGSPCEYCGFIQLCGKTFNEQGSEADEDGEYGENNA